MNKILKTNRFVGRVLAAGLLALAAAACASGGGGEGGSGFNPTTPVPTPDPPDQQADPSEFETAEYFNTEGLDVIHASAAYARGATGDGITVAVIDTGVDETHPDLIGQVLTSSLDINANQRAGNDIDPEGHGTLVAGVIAALKNDSAVHGVAYESSILDIRADEPGSCLNSGDDDSCTFNDADLIQAINRAISLGADIINLSLGGPIDGNQSLENAIRNGAAQGVLFVISAGNDAAPAGPDPDTGENRPAQGTIPQEPAYIAGEAASLGMVVAVGSINLNRRISDFSNRAGPDARNFYILAPGQGVVTTGPDSSDADSEQDYYQVSGTSFAAPYVSGALALMLDAFPNISPQEALQIILETADDYRNTSPDPIRGEAAGQGVDNISGVGILNLEAAFSPQGSSSMSFGSEVVDLATTLAPAAGAFGDWAAHSGAFEGLMFQDKYRRGFTIEQANLIAPTSVMSSLERRADWAAGQAHTLHAGPLSLSYSQARLAPDPSIPYERDPETVYTARLSFDGGLVEFGRGGRLSSIAPQVSLTDEAGMSSALGGNGNWARITRDMGRFSVDAFSSTREHQEISGVGLSRYGHGWVARAAVSAVENSANALGGSLQGRFGGEDMTSLRAVTVEAASRPLPGLMPGLTLSGGIEAAAVSLPGTTAQDVMTSRWSLGATVPAGKGELSFIVAQPRRAESGTIRFDGPVAVTEEGTILYDEITAALLPSGRQIDMETRWQFGLTERIKGSASFAMAHQPNHIAGAQMEKSVWFSLRGAF